MENVIGFKQPLVEAILCVFLCSFSVLQQHGSHFGDLNKWKPINHSSLSNKNYGCHSSGSSSMSKEISIGHQNGHFSHGFDHLLWLVLLRSLPNCRVHSFSGTKTLDPFDGISFFEILNGLNDVER